MRKAVFIDDTKEYLQCVEGHMVDLFREKNISIKTYLMKNEGDHERIEKEILEERPDFIFSDMAMPFVDGGTLIKRITKVYKPVTVLISNIENIDIHKDEFDYLVNKEHDWEVLKNAISLVIRCFELQEEMSIDQILATEFPDLRYDERMYLKEVVRKFKDVKDLKEVKMPELSEATNKGIHTTIYRVNKYVEKLFKKKVDKNFFVFELVKIYKKGLKNDK
ncbi:hypothetical protein [Wukongibacter sp. M2B1]|uniref:hypothetical protein n=1 Tax=Wukongibacter sp. M2B1 TaxID=3088895 RepID=UPI003D796639